MFDMHLSPYQDFNNVSNNYLILITFLANRPIERPHRLFFGSIN